jgi:pyrimidine operon attenuation protein/uracil phosphoribosyltransferase
MNSVQTNQVLSTEDISRKIRRIAFEIAERNAGCKRLIIAGVAGNGIVVAKRLSTELKQILDCSLEFVTVFIDKSNPLQVSLDKSIELHNETVILVDDVANSGRVMLYALKPFLDAEPASIQTMVLVERSHKLFPIQTDYVGLSIATTLQEHITVKTSGDHIEGAWLH